MQFIYKDLGPRQRGEVVEITLTAVANVRLMDSLNFINYKKGVKHIYTGGVVKQSVVRLSVPSMGHWHVTVDTHGIQGSDKLSATVKVLA